MYMNKGRGTENHQLSPRQGLVFSAWAGAVFMRMNHRFRTLPLGCESLESNKKHIFMLSGSFPLFSPYGKLVMN